MSEQLQFVFPLDTLRLEIPLFEMSWVEDDIVRRVRTYAHCVDHGWPWWRPGWGWK